MEYCVICKIIIFILLQQFFFITDGFSTTTLHNWDICSHWNGRRHFLELGVRGDLHAHNVSSNNYRSTLHTIDSLNYNNTNVQNIWYQCNLELVTCAECVIRITFIYTNFSKLCDQQLIQNTDMPHDSQCPCEHIMFSEPPYDAKTSGQKFCDDKKVFRSKTRTLLLKFYFRATYSHVFSLQYFSERNVKILSGSPVSNNVGSKQEISTPYFPMPYPRDYGVEHILTCESEDCHVSLEFTDFQLGLTSTMEIFDSNGQMLDTYTGEHFRPPIIISSGKSLLLQFRGNGVTGVGYNAEITFITYNDVNNLPLTDCGGIVEGYGGAITMMDMVNDDDKDSQLYDCIWIIKPANNYMMMKTHISLRVDTFNDFEANSHLTIKQSTISKGKDIEIIQSPNNNLIHNNQIVPISTGIYIRLRAIFMKASRIAIVYSVFNYMNCYIGSEFLCKNNHCISIRLHCDGFDHCGDGSDEIVGCENKFSQIQNDQNWYSQKPNYYFPKIDQYASDISTATSTWTFAVVLVLSGWMLILYKMGSKAKNQIQIQNHLQTISELLDRQEENPPPAPAIASNINNMNSPNNNSNIINTPSQPNNLPSHFDAPPDYEEVMKFETYNEAILLNPNRLHHSRRPAPSIPTQIIEPEELNQNRTTHEEIVVQPHIDESNSILENTNNSVLNSESNLGMCDFNAREANNSSVIQKNNISRITSIRSTSADSSQIETQPSVDESHAETGNGTIRLPHHTHSSCSSYYEDCYSRISEVYPISSGPLSLDIHRKYCNNVQQQISKSWSLPALNCDYEVFYDNINGSTAWLNLDSKKMNDNNFAFNKNKYHILQTSESLQNVIDKKVIEHNIDINIQNDHNGHNNDDNNKSIEINLNLCSN